MCNTTGETSGSGAGVAMVIGVGATIALASAAAALVNRVGDSVGRAVGDPAGGGGIPWALVLFVGGAMVLLAGIACWALIRVRRRSPVRMVVFVPRRVPAAVPVARRRAALPAGPVLTPPRGWPALPVARPALTAGRPVRPDVVLAPAAGPGSGRRRPWRS